MKEIKETPFGNSEEEQTSGVSINTTGNDNNNGALQDPREIARKRKSSNDRILGITLLVLGMIVLSLALISFVFHSGQPDQTALQIERILGFVLSSLAIVLGLLLIISASRSERRKDYVLEPIVNQSTEVDTSLEQPKERLDGN